MKKAISIILILSIIAVALAGCGSIRVRAGREVSIRWSEVNLREAPTTNSAILTTLTEGRWVTLTGNQKEYWGGDGSDPTEHWVEVHLSGGKTGWIVSLSIQWR